MEYADTSWGLTTVSVQLVYTWDQLRVSYLLKSLFATFLLMPNYQISQTGYFFLTSIFILVDDNDLSFNLRDPSCVIFSFFIPYI